MKKKVFIVSLLMLNILSGCGAGQDIKSDDLNSSVSSNLSESIVRPDNGLIFSYWKGKYTVTGCEKDEKEIIIPSTWNDGINPTGPVTGIASKAFYGNSTLESIVINESVTDIGNSAFYSCANLKSVTLPDSLLSIGDLVFSYCPRLVSMVIPDNITSLGVNIFKGCNNLESLTIGNLCGVTLVSLFGSDSSSLPSRLKEVAVNKGDIPDKCFSGCSSLTSIRTPSDAKIIGDSAFQGCSSLTSIDIPNSVTDIGYWAFYSCSSLTSVRIPEGVTNIKSYVFAFCPSLVSVILPDSIETVNSLAFTDCSSLQYNEYGNAYYLGSDNNPYLVLIMRKDSEITNCEINEETKIICQAAFSWCKNLYSIEIPDTIQIIKESTFDNCSSLVSVVIPASVKKIEYGAFQRCPNLTNVYYKGTEEEWNEIEVDVKNDNLLSAVKYFYSESKPSSTGKYWHYIDDEPVIWE